MAKLSKIETKYRQHIREMEAVPPAQMWSRIETSLDKKTSRKGMVWLWRAAAAAMIVGFISLGVYFLIPENQHVEMYSFSEKPEVFSNETKTLEKQNIEESSTQYSPPIVTHVDESHHDPITKPSMQSSDRQLALLKPDYRTKEETTHLSHTPDIPFFSSRKVRVNKLMAQSNQENWNDRYNVNNHIWYNENYTNNDKPERRFHIGASVSPVYSYRQTSGSQPMPMGTLYASDQFNERGVVNAGGALNVNYQFHNRWAVESGVRFARMGQEVRTNFQQENIFAMAETSYNQANQTNIKSVPLNNSMGTISQPHSPERSAAPSRTELSQSPQSVLMDVNRVESINNEARFEQLIDYVEIPFTLRYYMIDREIKVSLAGGVSTNWLVSNRVHLRDGDDRNSIGKTEGLSTLNWSTHAGLTFSIPVFGPLSFTMEPRVNYFLNEINQDYPVRYKPYSFGVYSGIQYTFGE
ncbi:outer membrane beta-barrel protein [Natronoflexus pectinivorans]|uniref:Outer membrane protein with beta-barrel domain n=1 Tax=Natronoflexus pectinivorans TaxID=682526 RepID=A0A4R2GGZ0_9BACT|nr:outer membrane beta-barrel protein [Natronoflexus pectinivorans]TCO07404.1 outer membrane protein with beta-barrel domain [Natronoflexus pectinivorans]